MPALKIVWHSNQPGHSGYGNQTEHFVPLLASLGHEVVISAFNTPPGHPTQWNGHTVLHGGQQSHGADILPHHARQVHADLVITLMDSWALGTGTGAADIRELREKHGIPVACWTPVDCDRLGLPDTSWFRASGAIPIAMSRSGERALREAGLSPLYVPHGCGTSVFTPPGDRKELRKHAGLEGTFTIALNAANNHPRRKGFPEQFAAFARFRKRHPEARLLVHSAVTSPVPGTADLARLANQCGIADTVKFTSQYDYLAGLITAPKLAAWYGAADLVTNCSYGEGFGLAVLEAQACGTPVAVTDGSAMSELCGSGWKVPGEPDWMDGHGAWWVKPSIAGIDAAYEKAWTMLHGRGDGTAPDGQALNRHRRQAREFAVRYDTMRVLGEHWVPALAELARLTPTRKKAA